MIFSSNSLFLVDFSLEMTMFFYAINFRWGLDLETVLASTYDVLYGLAFTFLPILFDNREHIVLKYPVVFPK